MRIVVFLASLFFMLPGGGFDVFAGTLTSKMETAVCYQNQTDNSEYILQSADAGLESIQNPTAPEENKLYICEDAEEEDNQSYVKKYQSLPGLFAGLWFRSSLVIFHYSFQSLPYFYRSHSPSYIFQRTLLI